MELIRSEDYLKTYGDIDSKFRFVILASKRAKELLRGAKPKIKSKSKNPIRIAQDEVAKNLIDYEIIQPKKEEVLEPEEEEMIGEELDQEIEDGGEKGIREDKRVNMVEEGSELEANDEEPEKNTEEKEE